MEKATAELKMMWDQRHADPDKQPSAAEVLLENLHLLPETGNALDLACGLGGNAMELARFGLEVSAWDISSVAVERLQHLAASEGLVLNAEQRDVEQDLLTENAFDVIVVSYFLNRDLMPALITALKPGGLIFYQTFTRIAVSDTGPSNSAYRLGDNELIALLSPLSLRFYREENRLGDLRKGFRDVAMIVAQKV
ncbi:MAG: methyltransferase type 12 [Gammaproteobacteria bacterium (ex Lamellibrachia satsuma)]|nr:MAG: methyltransferase domain-containing protein [Gammaproteobacteria bacterium (ex Lamellibrachia satsuma)]RRS34774.1 MAG: methyltransferase type 12 [Gammaproteobacteria bacterium (ex Lamellibrachia satsuma)]RRS34855.1 MAG: methyltransferase type 12 [Gammaproteobacteria bacterium (ex Lamellibrachia satsuma)]